jgi:hypothetical protein
MCVFTMENEENPMDKMFDQTPVAVFVVALLVGSMLLGTVSASSALSLYDDFNDPSLLIRADLWQNTDNFCGVAPGRLESVRVIDALLASQLPVTAADPSNPKLLFAKRVVLPPGAFQSESVDLDDLIMLQTRNATGIQADVAMKTCFLGAAGFVQVAVDFPAFNDGTPFHGPLDASGDIFARFRVGCSTTNQAEITWDVFRCLGGQGACVATTSLGTGSFGAAIIGQEYRLHVMKSGSSFVFSAVGQTQLFPVPGSPTAPPRGVRLSGLQSRIDATTPSNGGQWAVVATFDNVMIDQ